MKKLKFDDVSWYYDITHRVGPFLMESFDCVPAFESRLRRLVANRDVRVETVSVVPISTVECLWVHEPGMSSNWEELAERLHYRWNRLAPQCTEVFCASTRLVNSLGGRMAGQFPPPDALSHDLGVTAVALSLFAATPMLRSAWIPEALLDDVYGTAKPDGALASRSGLECLIEFCGQYSAERLSRLGALSDATGLPLHFFTVSDKENHQ